MHMLDTSCSNDQLFSSIFSANKYHHHFSSSALQNGSLSKPQLCLSAHERMLFFRDLLETSASCHDVPCYSIIKVWDVIVGVSSVALRGIVGNAQMVESREEDKDPNDEDRYSSVTVVINVKISC